MVCPGKNFFVVDDIVPREAEERDGVDCLDFCFTRAVRKDKGMCHTAVQHGEGTGGHVTFTAYASKHFGQRRVTHFLALPTAVATKLKSSVYGDRLFVFNKAELGALLDGSCGCAFR